MNVTYFGHSCFQLTINGKTILFDPFITPNDLAKDIDVSQIKPDYILVSHGHFDHINDVEQIAKQSNAKVVASWEVIEYFKKKGLENVHPMNTGGTWEFDFGIVKCVTAVHSSGLPDGTDGGSPMGFVISFMEDDVNKNVYFAGDTALTYDMKLIEETYDHIDFAILPVGDNLTMGIDDAVKAATFVNADTVIPMHYDTFGLIEIDHEYLKDAFNDFELQMFNIGEEKTLN